ncbi:MAG: hypothetical protein HRU20_25255 [Pseudomonadales bacterium]|nr:hypothetical protein [Pseudomonadales bacterium]
MEYHFTISVKCTADHQAVIDSLKCLGEGVGGAAFEDCFEPLGDEALDKAADLVEEWMPELSSGETYSEEADLFSVELHGGGSGETFADSLEAFYKSFGCLVQVEGEWV